MIEVLFATNSLTDIGCTYKLFHRDVINRLKNEWREGSPLFATELILLTVARRIPFIEIPITFRERVGASTLTARWHQLVKWGLRIFWYIISFWARWLWRRLFRPKTDVA